MCVRAKKTKTLQCYAGNNHSSAISLSPAIGKNKIARAVRENQFWQIVTIIIKNTSKKQYKC